MLLLPLLKTQGNTKPLKAITGPLPPPLPNYFQTFTLHPSQKIPIYSKYFPKTSSHLPWSRRAFFILAAWPIRTIFGNLSSFIYIRNLQSRIEPDFFYSLLFGIKRVIWIPKSTCRQFLLKIPRKSSSAF